MKQIVRDLIKKGRHNELVWRHGFNFMPSLNYRLSSRVNGNPHIAKVAEDLNRNGIAITRVKDLFGNADYFNALESEVESILTSRSDELLEKKHQASNADSIGQKTFNVELLGSEVEFDEKSIFARFALSTELLNIANSYFGMLVNLRYYNVWQTFATDGAARESQLWHFDREDNYILKVFLYLKDVDEGCGPFTYAPGTHRKGKFWGRQPESTLENNVRRSTDEQMSAAVSADKWIKAVGEKGTIIFADTRGFHKGGEARTGDRIMYTCMYTSPSSESKRLLKFPEKFKSASLSKNQLHALEIR